jgi:hypothetical protein
VSRPSCRSAGPGELGRFAAADLLRIRRIEIVSHQPHGLCPIPHTPVLTLRSSFAATLTAAETSRLSFSAFKPTNPPNTHSRPMPPLRSLLLLPPTTAA